MTINYYQTYSSNVVFNFGDGLDADGAIINIISAKEFSGAGEWHHIAGVVRFDSEDPNDPNAVTTTGALYLDGVYQVPVVHQFPSIDVLDYEVLRDQWNTALRIGAPGNTGSRPFNGMVDDVKIYDRPLSEAEIRFLAQ